MDYSAVQISSKGSWNNTAQKFWVVIGGERGKGRPFWIGVYCDWSRGGEKEAMFCPNKGGVNHR